MVKLFSLEDAAAQLNTTERKVRGWVELKRIEFVKVGRTPMISQTAIDAYIASRTVPVMVKPTGPRGIGAQKKTRVA